MESWERVTIEGVIGVIGVLRHFGGTLVQMMILVKFRLSNKARRTNGKLSIPLKEMERTTIPFLHIVSTDIGPVQTDSVGLPALIYIANTCKMGKRQKYHMGLFLKPS